MIREEIKEIRIEWIEEFRRLHKRKPRILHIGNIANNAYQNAKMLNEAGCECEVLCQDYYHIAGCPEWDDAEITGEIKDQYFPDWKSVNLNGFQRPRWFAQGKGNYCVRYLLARRRGEKAKAERYWKQLQWQREWYIRLNTTIHPVDNISEHLVFYIANGGYYLIQILHKIYLGLRYVALAPYYFCKHPNKTIKKYYRRFILKQAEQVEVNPLLKNLSDEFHRLFPERSFEASEMMLNYYNNAQYYRELMQEYDVVIAYADMPILPYLAGIKNYVAFEHGSIRDLPYQRDARGYLMLLSYANAKAIYITNLDCVSSAEYISANTDAEIIYGLHGLDTRRIMQKADAAGKAANTLRTAWQKGDSHPVFFCPSRHSVDPVTGRYIKGDEQMIQAVERLADEGFAFHLILVNFGLDTPSIKETIACNPRLESMVQWIEPLPKAQLLTAYQACDAVLDQFYLPAFGAITIEVLCSGGGALISQKVDDAVMQTFFGEQLPSYLCEKTEDIYFAMRNVIENPERCRIRAEKGREWVIKHHGRERIVEQLSKAFASCTPIEEKGA